MPAGLRPRALRHNWAAAAAPWLTRTASSIFRSLSLPTKAATTSPRTRWSLHTRLLLRLDRRLAGVTIPAAAAAGLRRARPPVFFSPQVSTQIKDPWTLDPPQQLPRPRPLARSPDSGRPHRPLSPRTTLHDWSSFQGCLCKSGVYLWTSNSFQGSIREMNLTPFMCFSCNL
jgi:hypothetical protein